MSRDRAAVMARQAIGGVALGALAYNVGVSTEALAGVAAGLAGAVVAHRVQLSRFAAGVRRSAGTDWMDRIPPSMAPLRDPLLAVEAQINARSEALRAVTARERLREVAVDALELEVDTLDRALGESRADMAEVLQTLDRVLSAAAPEATLRRELVELRELVRLSVYAELPGATLPLGDVVAHVVAAGVPRGRVRVVGHLPTVTAPEPLVEALVRSLLGHALAMGEQAVQISGALDGAMVVIEVTARTRPEPTIHLAMARRATAILGGDIHEKRDRFMVVIPARFVPGLRAVSPRRFDWDIPEAM